MKSEALVKNMEQLVVNAMTMRQAWLQRLLDPRRNIDTECGHPAYGSLLISDYKQMYERGDVASRVVSLFPEESWSQPPEIYETEDETETTFELAWKALGKKVPLVPYLLRADVLSGIGRFGILLLGLDDGENMSAAVPMVTEPQKKASRKLLFLRPLDESVVVVKQIERDARSPRYGQPLLYDISFQDEGSQSSSTTLLSVHWSRIIHICDNRSNSEIYGHPRLEKVMNRILDLKKIAGGSGEMFWKGGFPGLSMEAHPNLQEDVTIDLDATRKQADDYFNGLQRFIATVGMEVKSLSVNVADPTPHVNIQLQLMTAAMGVPMRVFMGSEQSQLASQEDSTAWNKRLTRRREDYISPFIITPLVQRLIDVGVLPAPAEENGFSISWPDVHTPSDEEKAKVAEAQSNAMAKYVQAGADALMPAFEYLTIILGLDDLEAKAVIKAAATAEPLIPEPVAPPLLPAPSVKPGTKPTGAKP